MYELLLKWGLDTLQKSTIEKSGQDLTVMLEAIRVKNQIVVERFKYGREASIRCIALAIQLESALEEYRTSLNYQTDGTIGSARKFAEDLVYNLHPGHFRELSKVRNEFDTTNDLLAVYSRELIHGLHADTILKIIEKKQLSKGSDIARLYRGLWTMYTSLMSTLVRVTSSDLRFWLVDEPYIEVAQLHAEQDFQSLFDWLVMPEGHGDHFRLSLEKPSGLKRFWEDVLEKRERT